MFYLDQKYLMILSTSLSRFSDKGNHVYNCRCPLCGDSQKNKLKARGYFYEVDKGIAYKCHNCSYSGFFSQVLQQLNPTLYSQYSLERLNDSPIKSIQPKKEKVETKYKDINLKTLYDSKDDVTRYALARGLKLTAIKRVYSCPNFRRWCVEQFGEKYSKVSESAKLLLPFYDIEGNLVGAQGRSIDPKENLRYETVKHPEVESMIFGLDQWNRNITTKIVEGPIDSLFLKNGLAVASSDLKRAKKILPQLNIENTVFCWDNEPRSREIVKLIEEAIDNGFRVFIWPNNILGKDFNDVANTGVDIERMIEDNTFSGVRARLEFTRWKKV
jgi:hypothetical protein